MAEGGTSSSSTSEDIVVGKQTKLKRIQAFLNIPQQEANLWLLDETGLFTPGQPYSLGSKEDCLASRNKLIEANFGHLDSSTPSSSEYQECSAFKEDDPLRKEMVIRCFKDTVKLISGDISSVEGQVFDYQELQLGILAKQRRQMYQSLHQVLTNDKYDVKFTSVPSYAALRREMESLYGPLDFKHADNMKYLKTFREAKQEFLGFYHRKFELYKEFAKNYGLDAALKRLQKHIDEDSAYLTHLKEKEVIYNLNPYSSATHFDWFRLPRHQTGVAAYFLHHTETDKFTEYQTPPKSLIIPGCHPGIYDVTVNNPTALTSDPVLDRKNKTRKTFWKCLYNKMYQEIAWKSMGITVDKFFYMITLEHKYLPCTRFFEEMSLNDAVKTMPDLFHTAQLPDREEILLFPGHLHGIVPPPEELARKIWQRVHFVVRFQGGKTRSMDLRQVYELLFDSELPYEDWGFEFEEFVDYCSSQWGPVNGKTLQMVQLGKTPIRIVVQRDGKCK